ncbi:hypothetical protein LINPERPRIM_LOCUS25973 [Linum perenne]
MDVLRMTTDRQFIRAWPARSVIDVYVLEYLGDPYDPQMIRINDPDRWLGKPIKVGPSSDSKYKALEIFRVIIRGNQLTQLVQDLTLTSTDGQSFVLAVNRQGFCYIYINNPSVTRLRINDYFGWSKYGVNLNVKMWNRCDMYNGETLVDVAELKEKSRELAEKDKELSLKTQLLERSKEVESMLKKSLEDKDEQLNKLMDAMRALVS